MPYIKTCCITAWLVTEEVGREVAGTLFYPHDSSLVFKGSRGSQRANNAIRAGVLSLVGLYVLLVINRF